MKTAYGWLLAGVAALGLNGFYQDGGAQRVHQFIGRIGHRTEAVIALATGNADRFLAEASIIAAHETKTDCPPVTPVAPELHVARLNFSPAAWTKFQDQIPARVQAKSDRDLARITREQDLARARVEVQLARIEAARDRMQAQWDRDQTLALTVNPVTVRLPNLPKIDCARVDVKVPQIPSIRIPAAPAVRTYKLKFGSI
jgi:hypothetical protein